jgi:plasmid maintenance system antidote protein VapI
MILKERIKNKGLKFKWIAEQIEVNPNTLRAYLNGERDMPQHVSDKIKDLIE